MPWFRGEYMAARVRRAIIAALIGVLSSLPTHPSFRHPDWSESTRGWARGPVWYIMTNAEYLDYRRLRSDPQRSDFIRRFWQERDPLPDTEDNELEREFWRRVEVADSHFSQDVKPGWKTERGKVFIMLGPPDNFDHDHLLFDTWGASRWVYDFEGMPLRFRMVLQESLGIPAERRFVKLRVRAENAGARTVNDATAVQASILRPTDFLPLAETLSRRMPGPGALRDLGQVMRVPEVLERNRSHVDVTTVISLVPVQARVDFRPAFSSAPDRTTVAVTLGVTRSDLRRAGIVAPHPESAILTGYLTSIDDEKRSISLSSFAPDPRSDAWPTDSPAHVFQAVCEAQPGRYLLDVSYQDTDQRIMGSVRDMIDVPAFETKGLGVSSLVLASRLEKNEGVPAADAGTPFMLGAYRVIPRTRQSYPHDEPLLVFYEITGGWPGEDGRAHFDLSYQFYLEDAGAWLPVGPPIAIDDQTDAEQAFSVPLSGMPSGRYRLEVTVADRSAGAVSIRGTFFEISPSGGD